MPPAPSPSPDTGTLDVRGIRRADKHALVLSRYDDLDPDTSFVLVDDDDPIHVRDDFERDHPGSYGWDYLSCEPRRWRIRISKNASTPLPRILVNTADHLNERAGQAGAVWSITTRQRDLDTNIIVLPPDATITTHAGPEVDVIIHVLDGAGTLTTELAEMPLTPGVLLFLPRRSMRGFAAGPGGLRYLTVHRKRESLILSRSTKPRATPAPHVDVTT